MSEEDINNTNRREFEKSMQEMGSDPDILRECAAINNEFASTEMDGLSLNK